MAKSPVNIDKPELDTATIERMEKGASSAYVGQSRRICLATMGKSLEQLHQSSKEMPDVFTELVQMAKEYRDHAKGLLEVAEAALFRLELSNAHGDIPEVGKKVGKKGRKA